MAKNQNLVTYASGFAYAGDDELFDIVLASFTIGIEVVEAALKKSIARLPVAQPMSARVEAAGYSFNLLSRLTGGAVSTGSHRKVDEVLTKSTTTITLSQTPEDTDHIRIVPVASLAEPLVQVASGPSVGEYSISGTTVTINASESADDFRCIYFYTDASNGETLTIDPDDLPSSHSLYLVTPMKSLFPNTNGDLVIDCAKAERTSEIILGGSKGAHQPIQIDFNIRNDTSNDVLIKHYVG